MGQVFNRQQPLQQEGSTNEVNNPETTWWCRILARVVSVIGAGIALILAIVCFVNILYPRCIGAGILQLVAAFIVLIFEAPICCQFIDFTKPVADFAERRTYFQKAIIYGVLAIPPIAICFGLSTLFGSGLIFVAAVIYGLMALGKKADRDTMRQQATGPQSVPKNADDQHSNLIDNQDSSVPETFPGQAASQYAGQYAGQAAGQYAGQAAGQYAGQTAGQYASQYTGQYVQQQFAKQ